MMYTTFFDSPPGRLTLYSDGTAITAVTMPLWRCKPTETGTETPDLPVFRQAKAWLEKYFTGVDPGELPPLSPAGTPYQLRVWQALEEIPYGSTVTYGELARKLAENGHPTSPRAVGGAVGRNPIAIFIPCHRVIGKDGSLTGFGGGMDAKRFLLQLEKSIIK